MSRHMCAKQVSVFLENKAGRLADVCSLLGQENINIRAFCIADTSDFGILRIIVNNPVRAVEVLKANGHAVSETDVLVAQLEDRPGGLARVLEALRSSEINIEYMYAFVTPREGQAFVVFRVLDEFMARTVELLETAGVTLIEPEQVYSL